MLSRRFLALCLAMFAAGCASSAPTQSKNMAPLPNPGSDGVYEVAMPDLGRSPAREQKLAMGPSEPVQCRFSPHFAFGDDEPLPQDRVELARVAECLNQEGARERPIAIVGRADARGSDANNLKLGRARAERVRDLLAEHGVERERMHVSSVGKRASLGFLPAYSHGFDRRVDVSLIYDGHAPSDVDRFEVARWR